MFIVGAENTDKCFTNVLQMDLDLIITRTEIDLVEDFSTD
jgi:hypothetical protein